MGEIVCKLVFAVLYTVSIGFVPVRHRHDWNDQLGHDDALHAPFKALSIYQPFYLMQQQTGQLAGRISSTVHLQKHGDDYQGKE